jgi:hypothetical protein
VEAAPPVTTTWRYFIWLAEQTIGFMRFGWPVTIGLAGAAVASVAVSCHRSRRSPGRGAWISLLVVVIPAAVLALGAVWACERCSPSALGEGVRHSWAMRAGDALVGLQVVVAAWSVWRNPGWRISLASVHALVLWATLCAAFMAGMSMSGDWL